MTEPMHPEQRMRLYGTPRSHFTRKVRLLLDHLGLEFEWIDVGDVSSADRELFAGSPAMSVPLLDDAGARWLESDHIAAHLVREHDPDDAFRVLATDAATLNARAVLNAAMAAEVSLILAERGGLDTRGLHYFEKARARIVHALDWLEEETAILDASAPTYLSFHFISFWDHLHFYRSATGHWPALQRIAEQLSASPRIRRSAIE